MNRFSPWKYQKIFAILALAAFPGAAMAQFAVAPYGYIPLGPMQSGVALTVATGLTVPAQATMASICAETNAVRYTTDGVTTPTAAVGILIPASTCITLSGAQTLAQFKAIQTAVSATLTANYFR